MGSKRIPKKISQLVMNSPFFCFSTLGVEALSFSFSVFFGFLVILEPLELFLKLNKDFSYNINQENFLLYFLDNLNNMLQNYMI